MRRQTLLIASLSLVVACKGDPPASDETTSTGAAEESSSDDGFTGEIPYECMAVGEFFFEDGVGLGAISVDAVRANTEDGIRYDVYVHGDDADVTQITIGFIGEPALELDYAASIAVAPNKPIIGLYPNTQGAATLVGGIVTYKAVGMATGELIDLELQLQLSSGLIRGCVSAAIVAADGG